MFGWNKKKYFVWLVATLVAHMNKWENYGPLTPKCQYFINGQNGAPSSHLQSSYMSISLTTENK